MRKLMPLAALVLCLACAGQTTAEPTKLETDEAKTLYSLGLLISRNLAPLDLTEEELAAVQSGLADGALGREPQVALEEFGPKIDGMVRERMTAVMQREKEAGTAFREKLAQEEGAVKTDTGMVYLEMAAGDGASPGATDTVKLHYHGTLRDGSVFDSSREGDNPTPATFALDRVIPCFAEGVGKMKVGGKSKLTCPPELAYGDRGSPPKIMPGATLVFEVELLEIVPAEQPAAAAPAEGQ